jgi:hypothetical protein
MRRGSWLVGACSSLLLIAPGYAWASDGRSPRDIVVEALRALRADKDFKPLAVIRFAFKSVNRDIVEGEHAGEPYVIRIGAGEETDDLATGYRLIETYDSNDHSVTGRELTLGMADEFQSLREGKRVGGRLTLASPAWEMRNPFFALSRAEQAADLKSEQDEVLHDSRQHVLSFTSNGVRVKVLIDANTHLVTASETLVGFSHATSSEIAYNTMGDVRDRTEFMVWELADGLRYPTQWDTYRNGVHLQTIRLDSAAKATTWEAGLALAPEALQQAKTLAASDLNQIPLNSSISGAPDPLRKIEEIAPGVVQIPGSWYTTLVRQDDGIIVIDAPISSGYSAQVIAEAQRRFPNVPIKAVITSTAFFWHIAGVREYASRQIPIYVLDANESTLRRVLDAPHELVPDGLALSRKKPIIRVIRGRTELGRGRNLIVVMPIRSATEPMLMSYIPAAKLLHTGEMIQPLGPGGALLHPESLLEIYDSVLAEDLHVDRLIGMHMSPIPWSDLESEVRKSRTP